MPQSPRFPSTLNSYGGTLGDCCGTSRTPARCTGSSPRSPRRRGPGGVGRSTRWIAAQGLALLRACRPAAVRAARRLRHPARALSRPALLPGVPVLPVVFDDEPAAGALPAGGGGGDARGGNRGSAAGLPPGRPGSGGPARTGVAFAGERGAGSRVRGLIVGARRREGPARRQSRQRRGAPRHPVPDGPDRVVILRGCARFVRVGHLLPALMLRGAAIGMSV